MRFAPNVSRHSYHTSCLSSAFKNIQGEQAPLQKLAYIAGNLVAVALSIYKCNSMGLLPTHDSDWLAMAEAPQVGHL